MTPNQIEIRKLSHDNAGLLRQTAQDVFDHPIEAPQLQKFLDDPRHVMMLAVDGNTVVGMASAFEYFHPDKKPQLFINEVGVAPTHRRRGIGRDLVTALLNEAGSRECVFAWLGTDVDNKPAQACFASVAGAASPQPFLLYEWDLPERADSRRPTKNTGK